MSPFPQIPFQLTPGGTLAFKVMEVLWGGVEIFYVYFEFFCGWKFYQEFFWLRNLVTDFLEVF